MAYEGTIEYMPDIPDEKVEWQDDVLWPVPLSESSQEDVESLFLTAPVRECSSTDVRDLNLDNGRKDLPTGAKCVVLGVMNAQKGGDNDEDCYVLLVTRAIDVRERGGKQVWERIGVGKINREIIAWEKPSIESLIR
jgi:hypothetical protein